MRVGNKVIDLESGKADWDNKEGNELELTDINLYMRSIPLERSNTFDLASKSEDASSGVSHQEAPLLLRLPRFKRDMYKKATEIDWKLYMDQGEDFSEDDLNRIKAINLYCLNLYKERSGEKNAGQNLRYVYGIMFGISLNLKTGNWWSTSFILAAGAAVCQLFKVYIDDLQAQADHFKAHYDKLDELFSNVSSVDLTITDVMTEELAFNQSVVTHPSPVLDHSGLSKLSLERSESENKRRYERESMHVAAIIALTFYKLEKKLGVKIENSGALQVVEYYISMSKACLKDIVSRKDKGLDIRFDKASVKEISNAFLKSIEEHSKKIKYSLGDIFKKSTVVSAKHFAADIESVYAANNNAPASASASVRVSSFCTLSPERFAEKNKGTENLADKKSLNEVFAQMGHAIQNETAIQRRLFFINGMSLVSCWLFGVGLNQAQVPYPQNSASAYLTLMGSTALFLTSQFFDLVSSNMNEKRAALRQAKIEYNVAVREAFNKGWVRSGSAPDAVHMINKSMTNAWYSLQQHNLGIDKFHSEDVATISMNMFKGLFRAMNENRITKLDDNDVSLIGFNWQAYINANSCERQNYCKFLCHVDTIIQPPAIIFFNKMPDAESFFSVADAILKSKKEREEKINKIQRAEINPARDVEQSVGSLSDRGSKKVTWGAHVNLDGSEENTNIDDHYNFMARDGVGAYEVSPTFNTWVRSINVSNLDGRARAMSI